MDIPLKLTCTDHKDYVNILFPVQDFVHYLYKTNKKRLITSKTHFLLSRLAMNQREFKKNKKINALLEKYSRAQDCYQYRYQQPKVLDPVVQRVDNTI